METGTYMLAHFLKFAGARVRSPKSSGHGKQQLFEKL
jgi:hypothetical protein